MNLITDKTNKDNSNSEYTIKSASTETLITTAPSEAKRIETIYLLNEVIVTSLLYRIIEPGTRINGTNCGIPLTLGATCKSLYGIVNKHLLNCVNVCLTDALVKSVFSESITIGYEAICLEFKIVGNSLYANPANYAHYVALFFLSSRYSLMSPNCKTFQEMFDKWNFSLEQSQMFDKWNLSLEQSQSKEIADMQLGIDTFVLNLLNEIIKRDFNSDSKHAMGIIKKIITAYLATPGDRFHGIAYYMYDCFERLVKNSVPFVDITIEYIGASDGKIYTTKPVFDRLVERTLSINSECIEWIITESLQYFSIDDDKKVEKALDLLHLLIEYDLITLNNVYIDSIIKKTVAEIEFQNRPLYTSDRKLIIELIKKGIGAKILNFLNTSHILEFDYMEALLKALAKEILQVDSEFRNLLIQGIVQLLNGGSTNYNRSLHMLIVLAENDILLHYPEHHELITKEAINWLIFDAQLYFQSVCPLNLMQLLIQKKIFIFQPERIALILKSIVFCLQTKSDHSGIVEYSLSLIDELIANGFLCSGSDSIHSLVNTVKEATLYYDYGKIQKQSQELLEKLGTLDSSISSNLIIPSAGNLNDSQSQSTETNSSDDEDAILGATTISNCIIS